MPRARAHSRVDGNHVELVKFWRSLGGTWQNTHTIAGALDGIAGAHGIDVRVEIKPGHGAKHQRQLSPAELKTITEWRGRKPVVWESVDDAARTMKMLYAEGMC